MFHLMDTHHLPGVIEDHKPGAGGSLINCGSIFSHELSPFILQVSRFK
jgi:hypothetical protein